jgi:hypothetical protein
MALAGIVLAAVFGALEECTAAYSPTDGDGLGDTFRRRDY